MCTLTWLLDKNGYEVFFNRDEQRSRPKAALPVYDAASESIFPVDPESKGTWIAVNKNGLSLCLLNNYQDSAKTGNGNNFTSRGVLIPRLILLSEPEKIFESLGAIDLNNYQPFSLCIFPANLSKINKDVLTCTWNGEKLSEAIALQPVISSAVQLSDVVKSRIELFRQLQMQENINTDSLLDFHSAHLPEKGKLSVCMHRDDARTQSLSHIQVGNNISFSYHDGPPCKNNNWTKLLMPE